MRDSQHEKYFDGNSQPNDTNPKTLETKNKAEAPT